jgi:hypothetical protein
VVRFEPIMTTLEEKRNVLYKHTNSDARHAGYLQTIKPAGRGISSRETL